MLFVAVAAMVAVGCAGDIGKQLLTNTEMQTKVMDVISSNSGLAGQVVEKILGSDSTRTVLLDKLMANSGAMQTVMANVAKDQTMIDGVINLAVQEPAMRAHVMTLFKGMQMAKAK